MKKAIHISNRLFANTRLANQSWFQRLPSALLLQRYLEDSVICYSSELDPSTLFDIFQERLPKSEREKSGLTSLYRLFKERQHIEPMGTYLDRTLKEALLSDNHELTFAHKSQSDEHMRSIVSRECLQNRVGYTRVASLPGICMFTDILGKALAQVIIGKYPHPVVYAAVSNALMQDGKSWFGHGDRYTFKCMEDELPITPIAMFTHNNKLEVLHPEGFVQHQIASLILSLEIEKIGILEILGLISHYANDAVLDWGGNHYTFEKLERLHVRELADIMEATLEGLSIPHDEKHKTFLTETFKRVMDEMSDSLVERERAINRFFNHYCRENPGLKRAIETTPGFRELVEHCTAIKLAQDPQGSQSS